MDRGGELEQNRFLHSRVSRSPFAGEFEAVIVIEVVIEEMVGSD